MNIFPYPTPTLAKIYGVPYIRDLGFADRGKVRLIIREIMFEEFQPIRSRYLDVKDGRTDRRTTYHGNTVLRYASRGKNLLLHRKQTDMPSKSFTNFGMSAACTSPQQEVSLEICIVFTVHENTTVTYLHLCQHFKSEMIKQYIN